MLALFAASLLPDLLDVGYFIVAICNPYGLYSHTVHAVVLQAAVASGIALLVTGSRGVAVMFAAVVLLHPLGDQITGRKLVVPGGEMYGYRLYEWPLRDFVLEISIVIAGWAMLVKRGTAPAWATSSHFLAFLLLLQGAFGVFLSRTGQGLKPNACPVVQIGTGVGVWSGGVGRTMLADRAGPVFRALSTQR